MSNQSPSDRLYAALQTEKPLQVVGVINAYAALMAEQVGFKALYLSGAGVANASYGLPDLGITNLQDVLTDIRRITSVTTLPLLVDADTGWGHAFSIARTVKEISKAGAAGLHIEDQIQEKRCGHRLGKSLVDQAEMVDRIKACVDARIDSAFMIMARSDALAVEGLEQATQRLLACVEAGANAVFLEAVTDLSQYKQLADQLSVPVLANITEFGRTPLFTLEELATAGVSMALYPLSAFRAMNASAYQVFDTIRHQGTQKSVIGTMQTREQLYEFLNYHCYEAKLDQLFAKKTQET